jgi:hypothetical protein
MANLQRLSRWHKWEPGLGNNRELPEAERFVLLVAAGLTKTELDAWRENFTSAAESAIGETEEARANAQLDAYARALETVVRMGAVPLTVDGRPVATLRDYCALLLAQPSLIEWQELIAAVVHFNSYEGAREVFSVRPSGGSAGTATRLR